MPRRNILVVGATGKQGGATVRHLVAPKPDGAPPPTHDVHVHALTRNPASPTAKKLVADVRRLYGDDAAARVELVKGDLTDAAGIRAIFEPPGSATREKGFWGVFVAQAFPGLGKKDDGERERGVVSFSFAGGQGKGGIGADVDRCLRIWRSSSTWPRLCTRLRCNRRRGTRMSMTTRGRRRGRLNCIAKV